MTSESIRFSKTALSDLAEIRQFVKKKSLEYGSSGDAVSDLILAVNEAVTNIIIHGYGIKPGLVDVAIELDKVDIIVTLCDHAVPFDPNSVPSPDINIPLEKRRPDGMGVHMMRSFVDEMIYRRSASGANVLMLVQRGVVSASKSE